MRIAAVGDLHCTLASASRLQSLFTELGQRSDIALLCGDLTDGGLPEEAHALAKLITASARIPVLAVLGNHDFEGGKPAEVQQILRDAGIIMLDGDGYEYQGVGFAGVKGFCGGFGQRALQPWGEATIKTFVHEAVQETLKLESALAKLRTPQRVAFLHYAPIQETVEGEPIAIFPFLGSSRLEEPINRYHVAAVFHGHAHHGSAEGRTSAGIPVYNVALPLLQRLAPNDPPFRVFTLDDQPAATEPAQTASTSVSGERAHDGR